MNKGDLINKVADDAGITKAQANEAIDSLIEAIGKTLKGGGKVTLVGFGTFSVSKRAIWFDATGPMLWDVPVPL